MAKIKRVKLIEARKRNNLTQSEVAKKLGMNQSSYSKLENEYRKLDLVEAKKLSKLLKVKIEDL